MSSIEQDSSELIDSIQYGDMSQSLVRRERLQQWMRKHALNPTDIARAYGCKSPWVRSVLHLGESTHRDIGEKAARKLEDKLGMPAGYMDGEDGLTVRQPDLALRPIGALFEVPKLTRSKQTNKLDPLQTLTYPLAMLDAAHTRPDQAAWLPIESADMVPAFNPGSQVLVNTSETTPIDGKVYALAWRDQIIIRRLHMTPRGYRLSLDAAPSAAIELTEAEFRSQVTVAGRIRGSVTFYD
jgi:hypothetical protein